MIDVILNVTLSSTYFRRRPLQYDQRALQLLKIDKDTELKIGNGVEL